MTTPADPSYPYPGNPAAALVEVFEYAPAGEVDRWVVYIEDGTYTMSDNGVCQFAGTRGELAGTRIEGRPVVLADLPKGVLVQLVNVLARRLDEREDTS